jgi:ABC-type dipeptide/oligopeptide/nickel transport system permease subunit
MKGNNCHYGMKKFLCGGLMETLIMRLLVFSFPSIIATITSITIIECGISVEVFALAVPV